MPGSFVLDARIEETSVPVVDWPLCHVRLKDDARFHWLLLLPRREAVVELTNLASADYDQLCAEILAATRLVREIAPAAKLVVTAVGSQLRPHFHGPSARAFDRVPRREHAIVCRRSGS